MNIQLLDEARKLSVPERIELVEAIWDSVHQSQNNIPLSPSQIALLEQRLAAYEADPSAGTPWDEVQARLERLS